MSTINTLLIAASVSLIGFSANAASREALNSGFHGNTPAAQTAVAPRPALSAAARAAYAQEVTVYAPSGPSQLDQFHGLAVR